MAKYIIEGGRPLRGRVKVSGSKNAALAILAATLLTKETCEISNVPDISDVEIMCKILEDLGAEIERRAKAIKISTRLVKSYRPSPSLVGRMRASVLLMGALLGRFGKVIIPHPGGDLIGPRPIDIHLDGFRSLGAKISFKNNLYFLSSSGLSGQKIIPRQESVTGTENIIMAATSASGKTTLRLAACEPEVEDLINFFKKMGIRIKGGGTHQIEVFGPASPKGVKYAIIPDRIEAGTFAIAAAATKGDVLIEKIRPDHLESFLNKLKEIGVNFKVGKDFLHIKSSPHLRAANIKTAQYPGFATDFQAPISALLTQAKGRSLIFETIFEERLSYISELVKMGAAAKILNPHEAEILGPTKLYGTKLRIHDLRAGATLILAALVASSKSEIHQAEIIDRGYENLEGKLLSLGAKIKRIS